MRRPFLFLLVVLLLGGSWVFLQNFEIEGLEHVVIKRRAQAPDHGRPTSPAVGDNGSSIRIASFNIQVFGERKAGKDHVMNILAKVVRDFDLVAIQEIRSRNPHLLPKFVELVNEAGRHYDFVIGERQGRTSSKEQYAYVFDADTIQADRHACYSVQDPHDLIHRPPWVCSFRVRGPPEEEAFTFVLINVHTDPDEVDEELAALAHTYRAVKTASVGEDDIILLGDLNADDRSLGGLGEISGMRWVISGIPTNTRGTRVLDNILFQSRSTIEFTGRGGVFDVMREFNLTLQQTLEVSDHLPVWAEFTAYEHGPRGPIAELPKSIRK